MTSAEREGLVRTLSVFCLMVGVTALLLVSCGREAPFVEPGSIAVESTPDGAAIEINGDPTGQVTPYTFSDLEPTRYEVAVSLDGYISDPPSIIVNVAPAGRETATFVLQENIGTLVVTSGHGKPQSTSLLPETHIAILREADLQKNLAKVLSLRKVQDAATVSLISGPSRTGDIEMTLTVGVHGPGEVIVFCL